MTRQTQGAELTSIRPITAIPDSPRDKRPLLLFCGFVVLALVPLAAGDYLLSSILIPTVVMALAAVGLNLVMGYAGLVSLGSAAFMSIGAFSAYNLLLRVPILPLPVVIVLAGLISAAGGVVFGLPSLRIKGFYLAASTLGAQFFVEWLFTNFNWFSNGSQTLTISAPRLELFGRDLSSPQGRYLLVLATTALLLWLAHNIVRSRIGRDWTAIRDMDTAAAVLGVQIAPRKLQAYGVSSFICGIAGTLWAFAYLGTADAHAFSLDKSFEVLFIVLIGGTASLAGNFLGAVLIVLLPIGLERLVEATGLADTVNMGALSNLQSVVFGLVIIVLLIKEPDGLIGLSRRLFRSATARAHRASPDTASVVSSNLEKDDS
ncbi:branched-chain amino acid ABC transporter permease [Pararobbsia silviterrae]|uniref:Branched-chain amino acid ABC transporter permease n=1 Tax=Pararobbsia silviterrae TaxID=1792498 RepID=A0A494XMB5_9BURK|nr:branched-chain amino acid ABC transporter permease [Pararobbsia silviterrae]RKP51758.1 branched-chain amino acid ABC transporter permease [Pararobbsia silviterrae]